MKISNVVDIVATKSNVKSINNLQKIKNSINNLIINNKSITLKAIDFTSILLSVIVGDKKHYNYPNESSLTLQFNAIKD